MLKVKITKIRAHVNVTIARTGSVLAGTVKATVPRVETRYEIESPADPALVAKAVRAARDGCFVRAALTGDVEIVDDTQLNGKELSL
jgi:hypothetical protein